MLKTVLQLLTLLILLSPLVSFVTEPEDGPSLLRMEADPELLERLDRQEKMEERIEGKNEKRREIESNRRGDRTSGQPRQERG